MNFWILFVYSQPLVVFTTLGFRFFETQRRSSSVSISRFLNSGLRSELKKRPDIWLMITFAAWLVFAVCCYPQVIAFSVPCCVLGVIMHFMLKCYTKQLRRSAGEMLALSYFCYLKVILPEMRKRMNEYEHKQGVVIAIKKYLILVPKSCNMPPQFDKLNRIDESLEHARNIPDFKVDIAGNCDRVYKSAVYKISVGLAEPIYVVMECPAILQTLWDWKEKSLLTDTEVAQQRSYFINTLTTLANQSKYGYNSLIDVIPYDESGMLVSEEIKNHIRKSRAVFPEIIGQKMV